MPSAKDIKCEWQELGLTENPPEIKLILAVIDRAVTDYNGNFYVCDDARKAFSERRAVKAAARYWLTDTSDRPWSLLWCLSHIVDDPHGAQESILKSITGGELKDEAEAWFAEMETRHTARAERKGKKDPQLKLF